MGKLCVYSFQHKTSSCEQKSNNVFAVQNMFLNVNNVSLGTFMYQVFYSYYSIITLDTK